MAFLTTADGPRAGSGWVYRWSLALLGAVLLLLAEPSRAWAQAAPAREYQLKAIFLFNFAQFVDWPPGAFAEAQSPLVIGVLGDDPFGADLDEVVRGEHVNQRSVVVKRFRRLEEVTDCHVLFISRSEAGRLGPILMRLKDRSILTVSDVDDFARADGMIHLVIQNHKIRLRINVEAAKSAHLAISSKLLRSAEIVRSEKG